MKTERYIISIFGIDTRYYTSNYITGLIDRKSLVCGRIRGCDLTEYAHVITTVRNPVEIDTQEIFMESLKSILRDIRKILNHPSMTISIQGTEYYYFT